MTHDPAAAAPPPRRRSWAEIRWRQFRNAPRPIVRAVLSSLIVAVVLATAYLAYDVAISRGAELPGGDLRVLVVTVVVVVVLVTGSVVTYLVVPQPTGLGRPRPPVGVERRARLLRGRPDLLPRPGRGRAGPEAADRLTPRICACRHHFPDRETAAVWSIRTIPRYSPLDIISGGRVSGRDSSHEDSRGHRRAARRAPEALRSPGVRATASPDSGSGRAAVRPRRPADRGRADGRGTRPRRDAAGILVRARRRSARATRCTPRDSEEPAAVASAESAQPEVARRPLPRRRLLTPAGAAAGHSLPDVHRTDRRDRTTRRAAAGVGSAGGGVAQSVRAAGLYPAGSRFESWLPYQQPRGATAATSCVARHAMIAPHPSQRSPRPTASNVPDHTPQATPDPRRRRRHRAERRRACERGDRRRTPGRATDRGGCRPHEPALPRHRGADRPASADRDPHADRDPVTDAAANPDPDARAVADPDARPGPRDEPLPQGRLRQPGHEGPVRQRGDADHAEHHRADGRSLGQDPGPPRQARGAAHRHSKGRDASRRAGPRVSSSSARAGIGSRSPPAATRPSFGR